MKYIYKFSVIIFMTVLCTLGNLNAKKKDYSMGGNVLIIENKTKSFVLDFPDSFDPYDCWVCHPKCGCIYIDPLESEDSKTIPFGSGYHYGKIGDSFRVVAHLKNLDPENQEDEELEFKVNIGPTSEPQLGAILPCENVWKISFANKNENCLIGVMYSVEWEVDGWKVTFTEKRF